MDRFAQNSLEFKLFSSSKVAEKLSQMHAMLEESHEQERRIDLVERELFSQLLEMGRVLLNLFVEQAGDGDLGESLETTDTGLLKRSHERQPRRYQSIFGELTIKRFVYSKGEKHKALVKPLDKRLGLPKNDQSYVLEDWLERLVVKETYEEAVTSLQTLLNLTTSVRSAERMNRDLSKHLDDFQANEDLGASDETLLVVTADGKGVPMRSSLDQRKHEEYGTKRYQPQNTLGYDKTTRRRTAGANKSTKQAAYVGAVYSIKPFVRTADNVLNELQRQECQKDRPRPTNKRLSVEMTQVLPDQLVEGPQQLFASLKSQVAKRKGTRKVICLMDGQRSLWFRQRESLPDAVTVLDLFHATEYLWDAAYCFEAKGSAAAEKFVQRYLRMLLEGKVKNVIAALKRRRKSLSGKRLKTLEKVIRYYTTNAGHMSYDEYLQAGYPIGSGVVEGACRHLVKDRMQRSGMRWQLAGATSMLKLRTVYLNGHWNEFIEHRIKTEQNQIYALAM